MGGRVSAMLVLRARSMGKADGAASGAESCWAIIASSRAESGRGRSSRTSRSRGGSAACLLSSSATRGGRRVGSVTATDRFSLGRAPARDSGRGSPRDSGRPPRPRSRSGRSRSGRSRSVRFSGPLRERSSRARGGRGSLRPAAGAAAEAAAPLSDGVSSATPNKAFHTRRSSPGRAAAPAGA